ncbi:hypothetical protein D3C87_1747780 [compost metagenome]|nr:Uncharacterised protein [Serratia marcescens]
MIMASLIEGGVTRGGCLCDLIVFLYLALFTPMLLLSGYRLLVSNNSRIWPDRG